ncbi:MAG: hypothetical protein CL693_20535 [Cellvibrionaceae bacterium]|nr:hypothetical protein [Cellvibrionaceae bacterium]
MQFWYLFILTLISLSTFNPKVAVANTVNYLSPLFFPVFQNAGLTGGYYKNSVLIIRNLLAGSSLIICPKIMPLGLRHIAELNNRSLDISLILINKSEIPMIDKNKIQLNRNRIIDIEENYYSLSQPKTSNARVGIIRDISPWSSGEDLVKLKHGLKPRLYTGHESLLKALLAKRIDIIISSETYLESTLEKLSPSQKLHKMEIARVRGLYLGYRASLPQIVKETIDTSIDKNITKFRKIIKNREHPLNLATSVKQSVTLSCESM